MELQARQAQAVLAGQEETSQGVEAHANHRPSKSLSTSLISYAGLNAADVARFEWFSDCASKFVIDVESGRSLRHYTFCNLLEGKALEYEIV